MLSHDEHFITSEIYGMNLEELQYQDREHNHAQLSNTFLHRMVSQTQHFHVMICFGSMQIGNNRQCFHQATLCHRFVSLHQSEHSAARICLLPLIQSPSRVFHEQSSHQCWIGERSFVEMTICLGRVPSRHHPHYPQVG